MALIKANTHRSSDNSLIPMINIVFLLLIFFMIAGQIQNSLPADILLPEGETGKSADGEQLELHYSADGRISLNGKQLTLTQLDQQRISTQANWILVADKAVTAKQLDSILRQLQEVGIVSLKLMTQRATSVQ